MSSDTFLVFGVIVVQIKHLFARQRAQELHPVLLISSVRC
jgi:hypothetical protein